MPIFKNAYHCDTSGARRVERVPSTGGDDEGGEGADDEGGEGGDDEGSDYEDACCGIDT